MDSTTRTLLPSRRGMHNLRPNLMFDLQRVVEQYKVYDSEDNPDGLIDIASSINVLMQHEALTYSKQYMLSSAENSLQYGSTAGSPQLVAGISQYVNAYFSPSAPVLSSQIMVTNGVSSLLSILALSICDPGEGIMYPVPEYGMFAHDLSAQNGIQIVEVQLHNELDRFHADSAEVVVSEFRAALRNAAKRGVMVKSLIISNPCNPLGRCYSRATLVALARFCAAEKLSFISDEIFAMSGIARSFENTGDDEMDGFTSVLNIEEKKDGVVAANIHCLSGASKDFGLGGLRIGFIVTRNELLWKTMRSLGCFTWVNAFADAFFGAFLADRHHLSQFLQLYQQRLRHAHKQVTAFLSTHNIRFDRANAGLYLWIDLSPWLAHFAPTSVQSPELQLAFYLINKGVYLEPGEAFSSPVQGRFRLVYSTQDAVVLGLALERLLAALNSLTEGRVCVPAAGNKHDDIESEEGEDDNFPEKRISSENQLVRGIRIFKGFNCFA